MNTEKVVMWAAIGGLGIAVASLLLQHRSVVHQTGDTTPFSIGGAGPMSIAFGDRSINLGGGPSGPGGLAGCGCGGSYGDYAVPKLNPIFGEAQRTLPYTSTPPASSGLPVSLIGNGASI